MGWEHEPETVHKAEELYCADRLSFDRVAEVTGVAASTLKRWAERDGWREKRDRIARAESEIRMNTILARAAVLERLLLAESGREASQMAFAVSSIETMILKKQEMAALGVLSAAGKAPAAAEPLAIRTVEDAATALRKAVEARLAALLAGPDGVNLAAVKEVLACMDLLSRYVKHEDQAAPAALSAESAAALREALGL